MTEGESVQKMEIKLDDRYTDTGRLSIEISEKTKASNYEFVPSGIYRGDSLFYIQGNYKGVFMFFTHVLINLHKTEKYEKNEYTPTIRAFFISVEEAKQYGLYFPVTKEKQKTNYDY